MESLFMQTIKKVFPIIEIIQTQDSKICIILTLTEVINNITSPLDEIQITQFLGKNSDEQSRFHVH